MAVLEIQRRVIAAKEIRTADHSSCISMDAETTKQALQIAKIAVKFSRWAREIAYRTGLRGAATAAGSSTVETLPNTTQDSTVNSFVQPFHEAPRIEIGAEMSLKKRKYIYGEVQ